MSKKCFWCEKKNWTKKHVPYCSQECRISFEESKQRKDRLKEGESYAKE